MVFGWDGRLIKAAETKLPAALASGDVSPEPRRVTCVSIAVHGPNNVP